MHFVTTAVCRVGFHGAFIICVCTGVRWCICSCNFIDICGWHTLACSCLGTDNHWASSQQVLTCVTRVSGTHTCRVSRRCRLRHVLASRPNHQS
jgi:hypothetical protein